MINQGHFLVTYKFHFYSAKSHDLLMHHKDFNIFLGIQKPFIGHFKASNLNSLN